MKKGLKIKARKKTTRFKKIENIPVPREVVLHLEQHIGAPSEPVVSKGDKVKKGTLLAEASPGCSAALHSPIAGMVKDIGMYPRYNGQIAKAVVIKKTGEQEEDFMEPVEDITPENIFKRVEEAGIVGMGGAGFPAHVKLKPPVDVDTSFLNGCECEPYLTSDEKIMEEEAKKIVEGFDYIRKAVGAEKGIIGIEADKKEAISSMKSFAARQKNIRVEVLPKVYPQGYEKMLITEVTGREVPSGGLPHDVGVSVHNAATCMAVYESIALGKPLIERVLTVTGNKMIKTGNVKVPLGISLDKIIKYYDFQKSDKEFEIFAGGPMMGTPVDSVEVPVEKTTSGILINNTRDMGSRPCIRCGKCVEVCPMGLVPQELNKYFEGDDYERMESAGLSDCMECGCCSYSCPSNISLTYNFKTAKTQL
ncbi:MAG: electron transport complex subunit RsxC [Elusimicrobiota bacterium]